MSIAVQTGRGEIDRSGFSLRIGWSPIYESPEIAGEGRRSRLCSSSSSSSSSIGKNSESLGSDGEDLAGEKEVESKYKGPLSALGSLEEALPMRSGISKFYKGKSKSFASLLDIKVSCAPVKDIGKQENAYTRKRRNLLASKNFCVKSSSFLGPLKRNGGFISKKTPSNGRSTFALAVAMNRCCNNQDDRDQQYRHLPPLHPSGKILTADPPPVQSLSPPYCSFPSRSFSLTDLHGMVGSGSSIGLMDAHKGSY